VDDNPMAREALEAVLKEAGADTIGFGNGEPALRWIEEHPVPQWPRVLVCDVALEDEDGFSVVRRLRQIEVRREASLDQRISALAVTGAAQPEHRIRALMAGFQMVLSKPVVPDELVTTVLALAGRPGAS
jgi:ATP-binding cassette subfamily B protein